MKLSEKRIKQIILEEINKIVEEEQSPEDDTKSLQEFKEFLLKLAKNTNQIKGASSSEIKSAADLFLVILRSLPKGEVSKYIQYTTDIFNKKTGNK